MLLLLFFIQAATFNSDRVLNMIQSRDFTRAESTLTSTASTNRTNARWHYTYGRLEFARNKPDVAIRHFEKAAELDKRTAEYPLWVGNSTCSAALSANVLKQAYLAKSCKNAYDRTLELDPNNVEARSSLIRYHMQAPSVMGGDPAIAERFATDLMRLAPYRGLQDRIFIATAKKDHPTALRLMRDGVRQYPDSTAFRNRLGMRLIEDKDWNGALEQFNILVRLKPEEWSYRYQIGRLAALSGQHLPRGRTELERLIRENPPAMSTSFKSMLQTRYGQILAHQKDVPGARKAFDEALRIDPKNEVAPAEKAKLR
jgi:tetratricopeptide (TPR) repeat protein